MKKKTFIPYKLLCTILVFLFFLFTACPVLEVEYAESSGDSGGYSVFQEKVLSEINFARTTPALYAQTRLKASFDTGSDNGSYTDLQGRASVGALELQSQLCTAASKYAGYLARNNVFGHNESGTPSSRCLAEGYSHYSGENIAAGSYASLNAETDPETAAIQFVIMLIIDQGIPGVGHRNNIMQSGHKKLGVGFYRDISSTYDNYTVHDFGSL